MKLTKQQISELTDTQLNRAMVWCYPDQPALTFRGAATYKYGGIKDPIGAHIVIPDVSRFDELVDVDFLEDWNQLMPLVVQHRFFVETKYDLSEHGVLLNGEIFSNKSLQRAYCEALVYLKVGV